MTDNNWVQWNPNAPGPRPATGARIRHEYTFNADPGDYYIHEDDYPAIPDEEADRWENPTPLYDAAAFANGFAPMPSNACPRCTHVGASGLLCDPCAGEIATRLRDPEDELVSVYYSGHGIGHTYRADVTR